MEENASYPRSPPFHFLPESRGVFLKPHQHDIPHWLSSEETITRQAEKDRFIDKTILSLSSLLARALSSGAVNRERWKILPELRIISLFMTIVMISLARNYVFLALMFAILLAILSALDAEDILHTLKVSCGAAVFSFAVLLPSVFFNGWNLCVFISVKVFMSVMSVKILSVTTRWDSITRALRIVPVPDIFILVLDISLRYIVMLGELTLDMFIALKLRSVGRNRVKHRALGGVAGSIFLFSRAMAEDMYSAMTCRGFTGTYRIRRGIRPRPVDFAFIAANAGLVWFFLKFGRL